MYAIRSYYGIQGGAGLIGLGGQFTAVDARNQLSGLDPITDFDQHAIDDAGSASTDLDDTADLGFDDAGLFQHLANRATIDLFRGKNTDLVIARRRAPPPEGAADHPQNDQDNNDFFLV